MNRSFRLALTFAFVSLLPLTALAKKIVTTINVDKDLYTKINMRYDEERKTGSYIQYLKLTLLPVNSKVRIADISSKGFKMTVPGGEIIKVVYKNEWGGKSLQEVLPELFSESPSQVTASLGKLSELDRKGIRIGRALQGMSKAGVMIALGPPAKHQTPSTEMDSWTYWHSRFIIFHVAFKDGRVDDIGAAGR